MFGISRNSCRFPNAISNSLDVSIVHVVVVAHLEHDVIERLRNFKQGRVLATVTGARMLRRAVAPAERVFRLEDHEDGLRPMGLWPLPACQIDALEQSTDVGYLKL